MRSLSGESGIFHRHDRFHSDQCSRVVIFPKDSSPSSLGCSVHVLTGEVLPLRLLREGLSGRRGAGPRGEQGDGEAAVRYSDEHGGMWTRPCQCDVP